MFSAIVAAGDTFAASESKTYDLADLQYFNSGNPLHGAGTLHTHVASGSVKVELLARNMMNRPFCLVEGMAPIAAASGTGDKVYTFSPVAAQDLALKITDVSGAGSVVSAVAVSLL